MATSANKNYTTGGGSPGSAGTDETRVDRPNEGLSGEATSSDLTAATPTRANFDTYKATGMRAARAVGTIYTDTETNWAAQINTVQPPTPSFNH